MKNDKQICVICGVYFTGWGNDAHPVMKGRCCDKCNEGMVMPTRIKEAHNKSNK